MTRVRLNNDFLTDFVVIKLFLERRLLVKSFNFTDYPSTFHDYYPTSLFAEYDGSRFNTALYIP